MLGPSLCFLCVLVVSSSFWVASAPKILYIVVLVNSSNMTVTVCCCYPCCNVTHLLDQSLFAQYPCTSISWEMCKCSSRPQGRENSGNTHCVMFSYAPSVEKDHYSYWPREDMWEYSIHWQSKSITPSRPYLSDDTALSLCSLNSRSGNIPGFFGYTELAQIETNGLQPPYRPAGCKENNFKVKLMLFPKTSHCMEYSTMGQFEKSQQKERDFTFLCGQRGIAPYSYNCSAL